MTKEVLGYKFNNENAAKNSFLAIDAYEKAKRPPLPNGEVYGTKSFGDYYMNVGESGNFFYIIGSYFPVLGKPQVFNIDIPDLT